jgi:hypothetical protein
MKFVIFDPVDNTYWAGKQLGADARWCNSPDDAVVFTVEIPALDYEYDWSGGPLGELSVSPPIPPECRRSRFRMRPVTVGVRPFDA